MQIQVILVATSVLVLGAHWNILFIVKVKMYYQSQ